MVRVRVRVRVRGSLTLADEAVGHHARRVRAVPPARGLELLGVICLDLEARPEHLDRVRVRVSG